MRHATAVKQRDTTEKAKRVRGPSSSTKERTGTEKAKRNRESYARPRSEQFNQPKNEREREPRKLIITNKTRPADKYPANKGNNGDGRGDVEQKEKKKGKKIYH